MIAQNVSLKDVAITLTERAARGVRACSLLTPVTACMLAKSPTATLHARGFSSFAISIPAPVATGWSDQLPGGICTH